MKRIQVMFDERLLSRLDADPEVRRNGRSAVIRRAAALYLRRRRAERIKAAYESAYGSGEGMGGDFGGWAREGSWPEE